MNKTKYVGILVAVVIVALGAYFVVKNNNASDQTGSVINASMMDATKTTGPMNPAPGPVSLADGDYCATTMGGVLYNGTWSSADKACVIKIKQAPVSNTQTKAVMGGTTTNSLAVGDPCTFSYVGGGTQVQVNGHVIATSAGMACAALAIHQTNQTTK